MSKNRYINTKIWSDNYFINLDPIEKLLFLYLLTNEKTNICGVYELPLKIMSVETGIEKDMLEKILKRFEENNKIKYFNGWIAIKNFIKHQDQGSPKVKLGIENELKRVPEEMKGYIFNNMEPEKIERQINLTRRQSVLIRDNFICQYCNKEIKQDNDFEIDHKIPLSKGGLDNYENIILSCKSCNQEKSDKTIIEYRGHDIKTLKYHSEQALKKLTEDDNLIKKFIFIYPESRVLKNESTLCHLNLIKLNNNLTELENENNQPLKKEKLDKKEYGELNNVYLSEIEYNTLIKDYGIDIIINYINRLSLYEKIGKYKNHNLTIRNWLNKANVKKLDDQEEIHNDLKEYAARFAYLKDREVKK